MTECGCGRHHGSFCAMCTRLMGRARADRVDIAPHCYCALTSPQAPLTKCERPSNVRYRRQRGRNTLRLTSSQSDPIPDLLSLDRQAPRPAHSITWSTRLSRTVDTSRPIAFGSPDWRLARTSWVARPEYPPIPDTVWTGPCALDASSRFSVYRSICNPIAITHTHADRAHHCRARPIPY